MAMETMMKKRESDDVEVEGVVIVMMMVLGRPVPRLH